MVGQRFAKPPTVSTKACAGSSPAASADVRHFGLVAQGEESASVRSLRSQVQVLPSPPEKQFAVQPSGGVVVNDRLTVSRGTLSEVHRFARGGMVSVAVWPNLAEALVLETRG